MLFQYRSNLRIGKPYQDERLHLQKRSLKKAPLYFKCVYLHVD